MSNTASPMALVDVFVAPKSLFEQHQAAKKWSWLALVLILAVTFFSAQAFYGNMSTDWLVEQQMMTIGPDASPAERQGAEDFINATAGNFGTVTGGMGAVMLLIFSALFAGYYMLAHKVTGHSEKPLSFGDWFSVTVWSQMPLLINSIGFIVLFATASTSDLPLSLANYASLNQLVTDYAPGDALYTWAESLNLFSLWSIALVATAMQRLSNMSIAKSYIVAALPNLAIFGIWFAVA